IGRWTSSPPQLGQIPRSFLAQSTQNVHSKEQIRASGELGVRSRSQHSQPGRSSSIFASFSERGGGKPIVSERSSSEPALRPRGQFRRTFCGTADRGGSDRQTGRPAKVRARVTSPRRCLGSG